MKIRRGKHLLKNTHFFCVWTLNPAAAAAEYNQSFDLDMTKEYQLHKIIPQHFIFPHFVASYSRKTPHISFCCLSSSSLHCVAFRDPKIAIDYIAALRQQSCEVTVTLTRENT